MTLKALAAAAPLFALTMTTTPAAAQPGPLDPWAGLYVSIGGHVGEAFGGNKLSFDDLSAGHTLSFASTSDDTSLLAGGQMGQLWRVGGAYIGIESDVSWAKNIKYLTSWRGVVGVPVGPLLVYGTGGAGLAITHEEFTVSSTSGEVDTFQGDTKKFGWTAGAGIQAMVLPRLSLGVEAIYYGLGRDSTPLATGLGGEPFNMVVDRNFAVVQAQIDYHFVSIF